MTFTLPSVSGKTLGTNGDDYTQLDLWYTAGSTYATRSGNVGVQSGTFQIWGVQLEVANPGQTQPSPLEKLDPRMDLANCQRFYCVGHQVSGSYGTAGLGVYNSGSFPATMRANPTLTPDYTGYSNVGGPSSGVYNPRDFYWNGVVTATGGFVMGFGYTASADL
jgi:hypothetical protein